MELCIMGTAAAEGWPALFCRCEYCKRARELGGKNIRTRSGALIDGRVLIDFSADTYMHMLHGGFDFTTVDSLLITHDHSDHFYSNDLDMRGPVFAHLLDAPPTLTVYGGDRVGKSALPSTHASRSKEIPEPVAFKRAAAFEPFTLPSGHEVLPLRALHARYMECLIYLVRKDGKAILYGHDTGLFPEETMRALSGVHLDIVTFDCTCCGFKEGNNHMGFPDNVIMRDRLREIGCVTDSTQLVMTHFSHNGHLLHDELRALGEPEGFIVAYDGITLTA